MKLLIAILLSFGLNAFQVICLADEGSGALAEVQTHFVEHGIISPAEVSSVIALAKQCGLAEALSVETYYFQPISRDWNYAIEVKGREVVSGRRISYLTVDISHHETEPKNKMKSMGKFWVGRDDVRTNDFAMFVSGNRTNRVEMPRTLELATFDKIISAFAARMIHYPDVYASQQKAVEQADVSTPDKLTGPDKDGKSTITKGVYYRGCEIEFTLEGEEIEVVSVSFFRA